MYVDEDGNIKVEKGDKLTQEEADKINETSDKSGVKIDFGHESVEML